MFGSLKTFPFSKLTNRVVAPAMRPVTLPPLPPLPLTVGLPAALVVLACHPRATGVVVPLSAPQVHHQLVQPR